MAPPPFFGLAGMVAGGIPPTAWPPRCVDTNQPPPPPFPLRALFSSDRSGPAAQQVWVRACRRAGGTRCKNTSLGKGEGAARTNIAVGACVCARIRTDCNARKRNACWRHLARRRALRRPPRAPQRAPLTFAAPLLYFAAWKCLLRPPCPHRSDAVHAARAPRHRHAAPRAPPWLLLLRHVHGRNSCGLEAVGVARRRTGVVARTAAALEYRPARPGVAAGRRPPSRL